MVPRGALLVKPDSAAGRVSRPSRPWRSRWAATATIDKIARDPDSVTLRGADGKTRIVQVRNPKNLEKLKVGDLVAITLSQAMAVVVEETK